MDDLTCRWTLYWPRQCIERKQRHGEASSMQRLWRLFPFHHSVLTHRVPVSSNPHISRLVGATLPPLNRASVGRAVVVVVIVVLIPPLEWTRIDNTTSADTSIATNHNAAAAASMPHRLYMATRAADQTARSVDNSQYTCTSIYRIYTAKSSMSRSGKERGPSDNYTSENKISHSDIG